MSEPLKRVLMITYAFPPAAYVGAHRTLKYCKYLPSHGWLPVVLTIDSRRVAHQDPALCRQIPAEVEVHRTRDLDPAKWLDSIGKRSSSFRLKAETTGLTAESYRKHTDGLLGRGVAWAK